MTWDVVVGDCRDSLRAMPEKSVQTCVTSPPYFGLRDYGTGEWEGGDPACNHAIAPTRTIGNAPSTKSTLTTNNGAGPRPGDKFHADQRRDVAHACPCGARRVDRQIGLEPTPDEFVQALVAVFREVRRVLRDDGTVWLNLGDSYVAGQGGRQSAVGEMPAAPLQKTNTPRDRSDVDTGSWGSRDVTAKMTPARGTTDLKPKDLVGAPWMVAFALRADGWYLRSDIIWAKPNPMPESVTDRPTKAHEYLFLLSKQPRYYWDADAIREPNVAQPLDYEPERSDPHEANPYRRGTVGTTHGASLGLNPAGRNRRSVWTVATQPFPGAHFATFPPKLIEPCILAGSSPKACGACGAPWRRAKEFRESLGLSRADHEYASPEALEAGRVTGGPMGQYRKHGASLGRPLPATTGWEPSCAHHDDTGTSIVLDPFAGSGTVGVVCGWHGRDFIGCELNPEYARMACERIALEGRPGGRPNGHEAAREIVGQLGLL